MPAAKAMVSASASFAVGPLAGASYVVVFGLYLLMVTTGLGLYAVDTGAASPMHAFQALVGPFGGAEGARWVHHVVMWLLLGFFVHHLYSALLTAVVEHNGTLDSIFTGNKWVPPAEADEDRRAQEKR